MSHLEVKKMVRTQLTLRDNVTDRETEPNSDHWTTSRDRITPDQQHLPKSKFFKDGWAGRLTNPGTAEFTPAEILNPSVVYESPKVNRNFVVFHLPDTSTGRIRIAIRVESKNFT